MAFPRSTPGSLFVMAALAAGLAVQAHGMDMPKRKSGLWEITTSMESMPKGMGPIQHCIDQNSDNLIQQNAEKFKQQCSTTDIKQQGDRITVHSVCKMDTTTTTMDAVFTGAFDSAYRGDIKTRFAPHYTALPNPKWPSPPSGWAPASPGKSQATSLCPGEATSIWTMP